MIGRRYRKIDAETAAKLTSMLAENITPRSPVRNVEMAAVPVDSDSRLDLLRFDPSPALAHQPVWSPDVETSLRAIINEHRRGPELARDDLWPTRTAVFTGPPGVGKTLAARWLAVELSLPLLVLDLSAVMSSFLGRTGANLRHVLDYAKGLKCVLLLDEIDAIAKRRDEPKRSVN
jgi:ATP-dependent 26S proteasome regulatory subunit